MTDLRVELLYALACPHHERARAELQGILAEYAIETPIQLVLVERVEDAEFLDFRGSPTIRIDGVDLVPPEAGDATGLGCRAYPQPDGSVSWIVPANTVRAAIRERRRGRFDAFARDEAVLRAGAARDDPASATEDSPRRPDPDAHPA